MEQQVAALIQQVMEMCERMRQSEEAAEQARQLLEAHRTAGQMLGVRMNRTEASVTTDTSPAGGIRARQGTDARGTRSWRWTIRIWSVCGEIPTRDLQ